MRFHLVTESGICLYADGKQHTVTPDHIKYGEILSAVAEKRYDDAIALVDVRETVVRWIGHEDFSLVNDRVSLHGEPFSDKITHKVLNMMSAGNDADALLNFLRKVRLNPSAAAQHELLLFCEANKFMIHEDGDLIAYKSVKADYTDSYTGKIDNSIGQVVTMERFKVNDDRNQTCSHELHFASYDYASTFGGQTAHIMILKINPRDVVSIPYDYNNQKGRCCRYEVVAELDRGNGPLPEKEVYQNLDLGATGPDQLLDRGGLEDCRGCGTDLWDDCTYDNDDLDDYLDDDALDDDDDWCDCASCNP